MFYSLKDLLSSWSVWILSIITVTPVINEKTGVVNAVISVDNQPLALTLLGLAGLATRAIKQKSALKIDNSKKYFNK